MNIAQIAPLWYPIPPKKYGGTERIIHYLTEGLIEKGHKVTLFACGDSKTSAKLMALTKIHLIKRGVPWQDWWWNNLNYSLAFQMAKNFDIIHSHWTPLGMYFQRFVKTPVLHTLHNIPPRKDLRWEVFSYFKESNVVFVSKKEKENCPLDFKREYVVYNGIDLSQFKLNLKPEDYFVWIGRIYQKKGIENAIYVAKKMRLKLILAGPLQPMYMNYFEKKIKPHLNEKIRYIGELAQNQLSSFYGRARGFIYPFEWEEPFGLCMIEAMACGTPVITFNRGSANEVVKNGKTGFVVPFFNEKKKINFAGLISAVKKINQIKRVDCREWVEKNFSIKKMVDEYEKIYYQLIK